MRKLSRPARTARKFLILHENRLSLLATDHLVSSTRASPGTEITKTHRKTLRLFFNLYGRVVLSTCDRPAPRTTEPTRSRWHHLVGVPVILEVSTLGYVGGLPILVVVVQPFQEPFLLLLFEHM